MEEEEEEEGKQYGHSLLPLRKLKKYIIKKHRIPLSLSSFEQSLLGGKLSQTRLCESRATPRTCAREGAPARYCERIQ